MANHREVTAEKFEHDIIHRAIADAAFRTALVADATGVIAKELAKVRGRLATGARVHIIEETPTDVYIVLPPRGHLGGNYDPYRIGKI
jgi:hypothetical protein